LQRYEKYSNKPNFCENIHLFWGVNLPNFYSAEVKYPTTKDGWASEI